MSYSSHKLSCQIICAKGSDTVPVLHTGLISCGTGTSIPLIKGRETRLE
jgi:hypothetical protein